MMSHSPLHMNSYKIQSSWLELGTVWIWQRILMIQTECFGFSDFFSDSLGLSLCLSLAICLLCGRRSYIVTHAWIYFMTLQPSTVNPQLKSSSLPLGFLQQPELHRPVCTQAMVDRSAPVTSILGVLCRIH